MCELVICVVTPRSVGYARIEPFEPVLLPAQGCSQRRHDFERVSDQACTGAIDALCPAIS